MLRYNDAADEILNSYKKYVYCFFLQRYQIYCFRIASNYGITNIAPSTFPQPSAVSQTNLQNGTQQEGSSFIPSNTHITQWMLIYFLNCNVFIEYYMNSLLLWTCINNINTTVKYICR